MNLYKNTSWLPFRFVGLFAVLAFVVLSSPAIPSTLHGLVHAKGITHSHGPHGVEHTHENEGPISDFPSLGKVVVHLPSIQVFASPLKNFVLLPIIPEAVPFDFDTRGAEIIPSPGEPPPADLLLTLLASHPQTAPPA